jgi:large subunit ribosomal protein L4
MENSLVDIEDRKKAIGLVHRAYLTQIKNARVFTASTKTKSEVRGGGKKPWRQNGTGNARAGSIRSPLWVGGGVIFGPKPRSPIKKINKKERRLAIFYTFLLKKLNCVYYAETDLNQFCDSATPLKTKNIVKFFVKILGQFSENKKILLILPKLIPNIQLACRNLKNVEVTIVNDLNVKQLLQSKIILILRTSFMDIQTKVLKNEK